MRQHITSPRERERATRRSASPDRRTYEKKKSRVDVEPRVERVGHEGVECAREAGLAYRGSEVAH